MKECSSCLQIKPLHEFSTRKLKSGNISTRSHCKQCERDRCKDYHETNRETRLTYRKEYNKRYYLDNTTKVKTLVKRRKRQIENRTPEWLNMAHHAEIESIYQFANIMSYMSGSQYHVDHIVPARGNTVSGLHVPWNLRAILASENISKSNRFISE